MTTNNIHSRLEFTFFPNEIKLSILERLGEKDLKSFAASSKLHYDLCAPLRFKEIILSPDTVDLFKPGGRCEHFRDGVRSIRFEEPWDWIEGMESNTRVWKFYRECHDYIAVEGNITRLRISSLALSFFTRVEELYLSYKIPPSFENNVYAAIIGCIAENSRLCDSLHILEFQVYKEPNTNLGYHELQPYLSPENQVFLGPRIKNEEIEGVIRKKAPKLPVLRAARISSNAIETPISHVKAIFMQRSALYYVPLTLAPRLRRLCVETTDDWGLERSLPDDYDPMFLSALYQITELDILKCSPVTLGDIERLSERFPNLESLDIIVPEINNREPNYETTQSELKNRYNAICRLKKLKEVKLPWPAILYHGSVSIEALKESVLQWLAAGLDALETVTFSGFKRDAVWPKIKVKMTVRRKRNDQGHNWTLELEGDTLPIQYEDFNWGLEPSRQAWEDF